VRGVRLADFIGLCCSSCAFLDACKVPKEFETDGCNVERRPFIIVAGQNWVVSGAVKIRLLTVYAEARHDVAI